MSIRNKKEHSEITSLIIKGSTFLTLYFNCHNPISAFVFQSMNSFGSSFYKFTFNSGTVPPPIDRVKVATCKVHVHMFARPGP